jgi:class 3 adenylate cyclase
LQDLELPVTRYAQSGDVSVAYQMMGEGPVDLIIVPGVISHVEFLHEYPGYTQWLRRLSKFARVVTFDKRGQGLSDRVPGTVPLEERMDDLTAIMRDIGSSRVALFGFSEGSAMSALFAATYPDRVSHLILFGGFVRRTLPANFIEDRVRNWGKGELLRIVSPTLADDPEMVRMCGKLERLSASPGSLRGIMQLIEGIDVSAILPTIRTPTLVLHRKTDVMVPLKLGREYAEGISGARFVQYPAGDHAAWVGDFDALVGDIEEFVTGRRESEDIDVDRILATVLFTDIVDSTRKAAEAGDRQWRRWLDEHDRVGRQTVEKHRGHWIKSTGDGLLATFDGPGRAVRCALALGPALRSTGLSLRAGLHTGEIEIRGDDVGGLAVHAASRVMTQSSPGEVWVSRVVTELTAGAGLKFTERGARELKGIPGAWELFAASA